LHLRRAFEEVRAVAAEEARIGSSRNTYTGMKMENRPYQSA
jgi:hypothetical protein